MRALIISKYNRIKTYLPAIFFIGGFIWDNLTLKRVDNSVDMIIYASFLLLAALAIILSSRQITFRFSEYLPLAIQFFFGGLFSSFVVYYFKSASSLPSFLFMLTLVCLLVGNEFIEKKLHNSTLSVTLFGIACFMYLNSVIPVLTTFMNTGTFILSALLSLAFFLALKKMTLQKNLNPLPMYSFFICIILLYFLNIIPPVPLAKKEMGIYHSVIKTNTLYLCAVEKPAWYDVFKKREKRFKYCPGDTAFCFSSIFAPTKLRKNIYHHWYYKDPLKKTFVEINKIGYPLYGGRDNGYRGFTYKSNLFAGTWRVVIKTDDRKVLGIETFEVVDRDPRDTLSLMYLNF